MESKHSHWPTHPFFVIKTGDGKWHVENLQSLSDTRYPDRDSYAEAYRDAEALKAALLAHWEKHGKIPEHVYLAPALEAWETVHPQQEQPVTVQ